MHRFIRFVSLKKKRKNMKSDQAAHKIKKWKYNF